MFDRNCLIIQWSGDSPNNICRAWRKGMKMYTARKKIQKDKGIEPSEFEDTIARAANNLVAATAAAPSVLACRAPTADTPSGSVSCYVTRVLPSGRRRHPRTVARGVGDTDEVE